ncbi:hypothetical protein B0H10DRAFT_1237880 [Mycena sp. CBHHK59/15]|nr:hypothetical protein B0H10DRAFT_1237880 [Mycena sp. CBHHK59/15]
MTTWRRRRSPLLAFFHAHRLLLSALAFSCATAAFLALRLRFFSTLLIYLPLVTICVPALAVFDTVDSRNLRKAWPTTRRVRFALSLAWCAHMLLMPKYPSSGRSAHMHPAAPLPALPGNGSATYFIAANLYDYGPHLPAWTRQIALLIEHLGRARVFVSVYESNSHDDTKARLRAFGDDLHRAGCAAVSCSTRTTGAALGGRATATSGSRTWPTCATKRSSRSRKGSTAGASTASSSSMTCISTGNPSSGCSSPRAGTASRRSTPRGSCPAARILVDTACPASECFLIGYDMHLRSAPARPRIFVNPQVTVGASPRFLPSYLLMNH